MAIQGFQETYCVYCNYRLLAIEIWLSIYTGYLVSTKDIQLDEFMYILSIFL